MFSKNPNYQNRVIFKILEKNGNIFYRAADLSNADPWNNNQGILNEAQAIEYLGMKHQYLYALPQQVNTQGVP